MSAIIKSTPQAIEAIATMQAIINGGLTEQIDALSRAGDTAGDPANWEGPLAGQFRQVWVDTKGNLSRLLADLAALRERLNVVQTNIQAAGGAG
jgi:hypothetical protein